MRGLRLRIQFRLQPFQLQLDAGQRGTQLMRDVGQKVLLSFGAFLHLGQQAIDGRTDRTQFDRFGAVIDQ